MNPILGVHVHADFTWVKIEGREDPVVLKPGHALMRCRRGETWEYVLSDEQAMLTWLTP